MAACREKMKILPHFPVSFILLSLIFAANFKE